jgi:hypothetical protein
VVWGTVKNTVPYLVPYLVPFKYIYIQRDIYKSNGGNGKYMDIHNDFLCIFC